MKNTFTIKVVLRTFVLSLFFITTMTAQVGINTIAPLGGSMLDITSVDKGLLIPRVNIPDLNNISPVTGGSPESLLVYNTNGITGKGFYYWNGVMWISMGVDSDDWNILGNTFTDEDVNYVGTTDGQALTFRTNDIQRFRIANGNQVLAMATGSAAAPFYSWDSDKTMGFWKSGNKQMDMVIDGTSFYNANANTGGGSDLEWTFNPAGVNLNLRVETDNNANTLFVDGANDNIGLGTNSPDTSAQLEMADLNKGILINRVVLSATNNAAPVSVPATGLLVYNTANSSAGSTEVFPGFYYWDGAKWVAMGGTNGKDWSLQGNAGTNPATNFFGTTDNVNLILKTNNTERMRLLNDGRVAINEIAPFAADRFTVTGAVDDWAINGYSSGAGVGVYGENGGTGYGVYGNGANIGVLGTTVNGRAIYGSASGAGLGVFGTSANNHGVYGVTAYTGGPFLTGGVIGWGNGNDNANGVLAVADKLANLRANIGLRVISGSTTSISTSEVINIGVNTNATDLALYALTEKTSGIREAARFQTNYAGIPTDPDARDIRAKLAGYTNASEQGGSNMYYGGYFYSGRVNNGSWAYAGARYGNTNYKIIGNGNVSTIVSGANKNDTKKIMFAPEAPEVLFEDYGVGQLTNGIANIVIDPIFANNITVNNEHPLKVFIQLEGDCNGVYVTNKTKLGFAVKELQNGNSNTSFSWHIVANRKNETGDNNNEKTVYESLRFPDAPKAISPEAFNSQKLEQNKKQILVKKK